MASPTRLRMLVILIGLEFSIRLTVLVLDYVEVVPVTGKGLGLVAVRDIPKGTRILQEKPLVMLPRGADGQHLWQHIRNLSESQLAKFRELSFCEDIVTPAMQFFITHRLSEMYIGAQLQRHVDEEVKDQRIFRTNCVAMGTRSQWGVGVFELYSRINHSCIPNVHNSYNPTLQEEVIHAVRDIKAGEEILTSYIPIVRTRKQRQDELRTYNFECRCQACFGPQRSQHERRRQRLLDIDQAFAVRNAMPNLPMQAAQDLIIGFKDPVKMADENITLLIKEGLQGIDLATGYRDCAKRNIEQGNLDIALRFAEQEREVEIYCLGRETEHMKEDNDYALVWIEEIKEMIRAHAAQGFSVGEGVVEQESDPGKRLSRAERRAREREEKKKNKSSGHGTAR